MKKQRFQRHFRKFHDKKTTGHPQYVFDEDGKEYFIIGVTGSPKTNGVNNIPLDKNPEPRNSSKAYIHPSTDSIKKGVRNEKLKGWTLTKSDKKKVEGVISASKSKKRNKKEKVGGTDKSFFRNVPARRRT